MRRSLRTLALAAIALLGTPAVARQAADHPTKPPTWYTPIDMAKRLGPEVRVDAYAIKPPLGFEMKSTHRQNETEGETSMYGWIGAQRLDGSYPFVSLGLLKPPKGGKMPTLDRAMNTQLGMIGRRRKDFKSDAPVRGTVNGLTFARTHHVGTDVGTGLRVNGVLYVCVAPDAIVVLTTQGVGERPNSDVDLAEASILTFRRAK